MGDEGRDSGDWHAYRRLILNSLARLEVGVKEVNASVNEVRTNVVELKVKAALWGAFAATLVSALVAAVVSKLIA